jgi:tRNA threonylcarbamoyladenosine modification (KEOPS) complex  Pcc1 subunit
MIGDKLAALKAAMEGSYRWVMLALMIVETILVATLVVLEIVRR